MPVSKLVFPLLFPQFTPNSPSLVFIRRVARLSEAITNAVTVCACVLLSLLLLLAGDVERNPGPRKERGRAASGQQLCLNASSQCDVYTILYVFVCGI